MRPEIVTCALFFAENLCFGPNFIRLEGTHPKNVTPETNNEVDLVVFYLGLADFIGLDPKDRTVVAKQYCIQNRLGFLQKLESDARQKMVFVQDYTKKEIEKDFLKGQNL